jgi:cellulose biosynthesis protein BcsQ
VKTGFAGMRDSDDKLAKDVARLYSWAHVEDAPYRDFFRQRKSPPPPVEVPDEPLAESDREISPDDSASAPHTLTPAARQPLIADPMMPGNGMRDRSEPPIAPPANPWEHRFPTPASTVIADPSEAFPEPKPPALPEAVEFRPVLSVYSVAGGVGKTTLCANLGRALYSIGDRVLLVDASGSGLLPFYFGANDLSPGAHTYFVPGIHRPPMRVIDANEITPEWLDGDVRREMDSSWWTLFDLGTASAALLPQILAMSSFLLIPLLPDLNSILTVSRVESSLEAMRAKGVEIPSPFYLFNQFDPENPIDQGARDLVLRQCGGRLLPLSIRHDPEAAGAIASRKTVIDHAPGSEIAAACMKLAALFHRAVTVSRNRRTSVRWDEL